MAENDLRVIPKIHDSGQAFVENVTSWGFLLHAVTEPAPGINLEILYWHPIDDSYVYYTEDQVMGVAFYGAGGVQKTDCIKGIRNLIPCWTDEEIFRWWDDAHAQDDIDRMVDSVIRLGLSSPIEQDKRWSDRIMAACRSADKDVRNAAVVAVGIRKWPVFRITMTDLAENDSDDTVRQRAEIVIVKQNWPERK